MIHKNRELIFNQPPIIIITIFFRYSRCHARPADESTDVVSSILLNVLLLFNVQLMNKIR